MNPSKITGPYGECNGALGCLHRAVPRCRRRTASHAQCRFRLGLWLGTLAAAILASPLAASAATATQQAYVKASNTETFDNFGSSVAISGDTMVVGAHNEASNATGVNGNQTDNSAYASGAAYVFVRDGSGNWTHRSRPGHRPRRADKPGGIPRRNGSGGPAKLSKDRPHRHHG